jgi:hypothetical protein
MVAEEGKEERMVFRVEMARFQPGNLRKILRGHEERPQQRHLRIVVVEDGLTAALGH